MKIRNILRCFCVIVGLTIPILTNNAQKIDSLKEIIVRASDDTTKINALNELGWALMYDNPDTAIIFGKQALELSDKTKSQKHKAKSLLNLGVYNAIADDYTKALVYYSKALSIYEEQNNLKGIASTNNNMGIAYAEKSDFVKALEHYLKALDIMVELGNKRGIGIAYNSIGNIYVDLSDYPQAIEYHLKSLKTKEELGDKDGIAFSYNNIGVAYKKQSNFPKAIEYYFKSLEIRKQMNDKRGMALSYDNIGSIYREQSDYKMALDYHHQSLELVKELGYQSGMAYSYNNIGSIYAEQKDYKHALEYFRNALKILTTLGNRSGMAVSYNNIGSTYTELHSQSESHGITLNVELRKTSTLLDSALFYLKAALQINTELDIKESIIYNTHDIADVFLQRNQYSKAVEFYNEAASMSKSIGNLQGEYQAHNGLAEAYKKWAVSGLANNNTKADYLLRSIAHHEQYVALRDSVFNEEKQRDIGKLEARHDYEMADIKKKQEEIEKARIAAKEQSRRNNLQYSASLLAICLLFGGVFIMGKLTLPKWAVELSVFVPFLILFEFLLVLTDPYLDNWTGGEPGFKLLMNAALAGLIFPIHNFLESLFKRRLFKDRKPDNNELIQLSNSNT